MKICFTGDVFLGGDLNHRKHNNLVKAKIFNEADIRIINLEQPISNNNYVAEKPTLYTDSHALNQLNELKINAVNLANNHIQDKGLSGINETINHLKSIHIGHFGAGDNISIAEEPHWLNDEIALLGYCEFDKSYLRQVEVADKDNAGVNPLRLSKIKQDLDNLPDGRKAILYFHWGMEHVWLPPVNDISLAKKLLEDKRVITIIGMHSHCAQGVIRHAGKKAYMSLGNFIFPNFYIKPRTQIYYPSESDKLQVKYVTRQYHKVYKETYKKWRLVNRISIILDFCTDSYVLKPTFVIQDDKTPEVDILKGLALKIFTIWFNSMSLIYKLPKPIYTSIWQIHAFQVRLTWQIKIMIFHISQIGIRGYIKNILNYVEGKIKK